MEGWAKAAEAGFTGEPHNPNLQPWSDTVCPPSAGRRTPKSAKANPSHVAEWTETQGGMSEILIGVVHGCSPNRPKVQCILPPSLRLHSSPARVGRTSAWEALLAQ